MKCNEQVQVDAMGYCLNTLVPLYPCTLVPLYPCTLVPLYPYTPGAGRRHGLLLAMGVWWSVPIIQALPLPLTRIQNPKLNPAHNKDPT